MTSASADPPRSFRRRLLHARGAAIHDLLSLLPNEGIEPAEFSGASLTPTADDVSVLLLDATLHGRISEPPPADLGEGADRVGVVLLGDRAGAADPFWPPRIYFSLPSDSPPHHLARAVRSVFRFLEERTVVARSRRALADRTHAVESLNRIGIALAAEIDPARLIPEILARARDLTQAESGSLYLVEEGPEGPRLRFQAWQNDRVRGQFEETVIPLDDNSLAGHAALHGEVLRLDDVYEIPADAPYRFNRGFDETHGYRTKSMLVVPMKTPVGRTIGILQLMNRKRRVVPNIATTAIVRIETVSFGVGDEELARSLASQAAVAMENARLTAHLRRLFEGFVEASVTAIEQRDPTTSGHSERVARLSCSLAAAADRCSRGAYAEFRATESDLTVLRYAAVLHDFGKVGVREAVLVKAAKLPAGRRQVLAARFEAARIAVAARLWERVARGDLPAAEAEERIQRERDGIARLWEALVAADSPTVLRADPSKELDDLARLEFVASSGETVPVVDPESLKYLAIPKGSLDEEERREIESHVTQTFRFLSRIPWTPELAGVPELAYLHHEKLDGSGYPRGLLAKDLPPQARMMTICDIYDALWAADRPYKKAVARDAAIGILRTEAEVGAVDRDLLDIFVSERIFEAGGP